MTKNISWLLQVNVKEGQLDNFKTLMTEMVNATNENETGTMSYEWFLNTDTNACHVYERYTDSAATMTHLGTFGEKYAERFLALAAPTSMTVYGNPDDTVRGVLDGFGAVYHTQIGGFNR